MRVPGSWKSIDELEDNVSIGELERMLTAARDVRYEERKFFASLKGIDLDGESNEKSKFEEVEERAKAKLAGKTAEEMELTALGFSMETE